MMRPLVLAATCAAFAVGMSVPEAQAKNSLVCEQPVTFHPIVKENYERLSRGNKALRSIVQEYRGRWDAAYLRDACARVAAGKPAYIGCLNGHRDWSAIQAMIPKDYFGMSRQALRPHYLRLQKDGDGYREAVAHCRALGVVQ